LLPLRGADNQSVTKSYKNPVAFFVFVIFGAYFCIFLQINLHNPDFFSTIAAFCVKTQNEKIN